MSVFSTVNSSLGESRQGEGTGVEFRSVVIERLAEFLIGDTSSLEALASVFGSNNKSDLSTGIGRNSSVGVLYSLVFHSDRVHERADQFAVEPHALSLGANNTSVSEGVMHTVVERSLKKH